MRILHINRNYITSALHQTMMNHLDELGVESCVFAPTDNANAAVIEPNPYVKVSECFNNVDRFIFDLKQKKIQEALEKSFNIRDFNIIHAYTLFTDGNTAMNVSKKYGVPYIVAVRNTDVNDFFKRLPFLRNRGIEIMEHASAICFLSESYKKFVFERYVPKDKQKELSRKVHIIPNGIDDFWLNNCYKKNRTIHEPLRLIYAGRVDRNKNIGAIQRAMDVLSSNGIPSSLLVIGKVDEKSIFKEIIHDKRTKYHKAVQKEELINYYRTSDIFVMPSYTESFGLVYAEAMSQGLPVIYTKGQGFDGQFEEGVVGYHVDADDTEEIAKAIIKAANNYQRICNLTPDECAKFNWTGICKSYEELYRRVKKEFLK